MLEYNFNELDDDFITLWSRYLLSHDETQIAADLEKLAELGQINAIQSYYLFLVNARKTETNSEIDKRVDENFYSRNFNYLLAQANRIMATDVEERSLLNDLMATYQLEEEEIDKKTKEVKYFKHPIGPYLEAKRDAAVKDLNYWLRSHKSTIEKIENTTFRQKQNEAINACLEYGNSTHDAVVFERYLELASSSIAGQLNDTIENQKFRHITKIARKELAQRHKTNPTPAVDFALAKNLIFFFGNKEKYNELGRQILTSLANRSLSATLSEYQLKGEPTLANCVYSNSTTGTVD